MPIGETGTPYFTTVNSQVFVFCKSLGYLLLIKKIPSLLIWGRLELQRPNMTWSFFVSVKMGTLVGGHSLSEVTNETSKQVCPC